MQHRRRGAAQAEQLERRIERHVEARTRDVLQSQAVQASLQARLDAARRAMQGEVEAALAEERRRALAEVAAKEAAIKAKQGELERLQASRREEVRKCALAPGEDLLPVSAAQVLSASGCRRRGARRSIVF